MLKKIIFAPIMILFITITLQAKDNIELYHAYGNAHHVIIQGRMVKKKHFQKVTTEDGWFRNLWRRMRQLESDEIESGVIVASLNHENFKTKGDDEGYFEFDIKTQKSLKMGYRKVDLNIAGNPVSKESNITVIDATPLIGIISDFDDTIIVSNVTHKIKLGINILFKNYKQRNVVPTMQARFEKILSHNPKDAPSTLFILSGSPQQLFTPVEKFLDLHHFPKHTLILKKAHGENKDPLIDQFAYKTKKIERLIKLYPNIRWIMFGDSGEKDPYVYKAIIDKYPNKVVRYYIRNVKSGKIKEYNKK